MLSKLFAVVFSVTIFAQVTAQESAAFSKGEISATDNHTGTIWLNELSKPDSIFNNSIALATYGAGAKLDWHIHPAGQVLLITEGTGYYQEKDQPVKIVKAGDIIKCMPGVPHWHGAVPQSSFAYMAVTPAQKGKTIWQKRVTDEEYNQIGYSAAGKNTEQEITDLSKKKWDWMSDKNVDSLNLLFAEKSMFVHMGGSWGKAQELATIKSGGIWYKKAEVYSVTVNTFGNTAILLNDIDLKAVVGGNEVVHSFMVTEVYIKEEGKWKMGSLTFSQLLRPVKMK